MKLKASTLMESLVGMVLILLTFRISGMIYVNVIGSSDSNRKIDAQLLLDEIAHQAKHEKNFIDESRKTHDMNIDISVSKYNDSEDLSVLMLKAFDDKGKILAQRKEIIKLDNEAN